VKFRFEFLVRVWPVAECWLGLCPPALVAVDGESEASVIRAAQEELDAFTIEQAREVLYAAAGNHEIVRCPEGTVNLVADRWFCKVTRRDCPIGAELQRADLSASLNRCDAPPKTKTGVRGALAAGYEGLHHSSGTYMRGSCKPRLGYRSDTLRQRWELQTLAQLLGLNDPQERSRARLKLVKTCGSAQALNVGQCARCLREVVDAVFPEISHELHVMTTELDETVRR
jgi:hypothetical protein